MIITLLKRELMLARRQASGTLISLVFFSLFILLSGLALDGIDPEFAPGLIWLAVTLSALINLDHLYRPDQECGALRHFHLAAVSPFAIVSAKTIRFFLTGCLPLIGATLILSPLLNMAPDALTGLLIALIIGTPVLAAYASFTAALLCSQRGSSLLGLIITVPLIIPVLLFGIEAARAYPIGGLAALHFRILAGLSCIAVALGIPASVAALAANRPWE